MVRQMADNGIPIKRIVRTTGLSRGLIRRIVRGERDDIFRVRQNSLTPWLLRLEHEWAAGCRNGTELWRRLRASGFGGSLRVVGEWATRQRRAESAVLSGTGRCPPARRIAELMTSARVTSPDWRNAVRRNGPHRGLRARRSGIGEVRTVLESSNNTSPPNGGSFPDWKRCGGGLRIGQIKAIIGPLCGDNVAEFS